MYTITIDIDWAPDFVIDYVATLLSDKHVKCTWFVTHASKSIEKLKSGYQGLFELGIHPNFLENTTHGGSLDEIFRHVKKIVPDATAMRTHGLHQSSLILNKALSDYGITADLSLFLPESENLIPHRVYCGDNKSIVRLPYFWEDDEETFKPHKTWDISDPKFHLSGLKIFNFHPMYIYLNCNSMAGYNELKKNIAGVIPLNQAGESDLAPYINTKESGAGTLFKDLLKYIDENGIKTYTVKEMLEAFELSRK